MREEDIEAEVLLLVSALEIMMRDDDVRPIQMAVVIIWIETLCVLLMLPSV